jgi:nitrilase
MISSAISRAAHRRQERKRPVWQCDIVIYCENYVPLLFTATYAKGIELYCAPTADDRDTWIPTMRAIAPEGRCFVLSASQYLTRGDCPDSYDAIQGNDPRTVLICSGSCIVDSLGTVLAEPSFERKSMRIAPLDRRMIARGK